MADAVEAVRQNVQQKPADELERFQNHGPVAGCAILALVLDLERHARAIEGDQPTVGDGHAVGAAAR
jgi:hypothetical protein